MHCDKILTINDIFKRKGWNINEKYFIKLQKNSNMAITLISLIITILIILILAGVSLVALSGEKRTNNTNTKSQRDNRKKQMEDQRKFAMTTAAIQFENREYTDKNNDTATIPACFSVTGIKGEDTIDEGLVIIDQYGNEFVWVPVSKENFKKEFIIRAGYSNDNLQDISSYSEVNETGTNIVESDETKDEAIAMYSSVETNGGFYIGRYEAGKESVIKSDGTPDVKVVVKKGANLYNYIKWGNAMRDDTGGAVEKARNFAKENNHNTDKVHSTLCYSVQWDTALYFIDPNYTEYAKDSSNLGWFEDNYDSTTTGNIDTNPNCITGKDLIYKSTPNKISNMHKNIYDMGGNAREWVMESCSGIYRVVRGGNYKYTGLERSASNRTYGSWSDSKDYIGFRIALYI